MSTDYLCKKIETFIDLPQAQRTKLQRLYQEPTLVPARTTLVEEGRPSYTGFVIEEGWASRERTLRDGDRQIINYLVPGDLSEPGAFVTEAADHTICTVTDVVIRPFSHTTWFSTLYDDGVIATALWWLAAHEEAVLKEHVVALGRRDPKARILYLFWELGRRLKLVGLSDGTRYVFPVSRQALADTLGLSTRHLGRILNEIQDDGIATIEDGHVVIHDEARIMELSDCHDVYLQITACRQATRCLLPSRATSR